VPLWHSAVWVLAINVLNFNLKIPFLESQFDSTAVSVKHTRLFCSVFFNLLIKLGAEFSHLVCVNLNIIIQRNKLQKLTKDVKMIYFFK
jgi:hypothetical protein